MMDEEMQPPEDAELLPGGEFISPAASPQAREFILSCRRLMYSEEFDPIIKQALTGAGSLTDGAAPVLMQVITRAEDKLGPLSDEDFQQVAAHLAGTIVTTAQILGDPEAEDGESAVQEIIAKMQELEAGASDGGQESPAEQAPQPQGPLAQLR